MTFSAGEAPGTAASSSSPAGPFVRSLANPILGFSVACDNSDAAADKISIQAIERLNLFLLGQIQLGGGGSLFGFPTILRVRHAACSLLVS